jgi:hypothetical protein
LPYSNPLALIIEMNIKTIIILFVLTQIRFGFAQTTISGILVDSESNEAIPYAHIGIKGKNIGTISLESGKFKLTPTSESSKLPLEVWFSHIGYDTKVVTVNHSNYDDLIVKLDKKSFELKEVVIRKSKKQLKTEKLGGYKKSKWTTGNANTNSYGKGEEYGIKIRANKKSYWIKTINFHTKFNSMDSILFRLNIYKLSENGLPETSMLNEQIFVKSYKNDRWITADVVDRDLNIDQDIIVSIEPIKFWYNKEQNVELFYSHCKNCGDSYNRESSFAKWEINTKPAFAIYLGVEFQ